MHRATRPGQVPCCKRVAMKANGEEFEAGVYDLCRAELEFPGWLSKLLTHPVNGLDRYEDMMRILTTEKSASKVYVNVAYD